MENKTGRSIRLRPRLAAVARLISCDTVADIGCDHGRLCLALLQGRSVNRAIACDVSPASLAKAGALAAKCGLTPELRLGDGLNALAPGEADAIVFAGMGGTLISELLEQRPDIARPALLVFQPMTSSEDLRYYLFYHGYDIVEDSVVLDGGRYYQVIAAKSGPPAPRPPEWPRQIYSLGWVAYQRRDPLLPVLADKYIAGLTRRVNQAAPETPEPLLAQLDGLRQIRKLIQERYEKA